MKNVESEKKGLNNWKKLQKSIKCINNHRRET